MLQSTVSTLAALVLWYAVKYLMFTKPSDLTWRHVMIAIKPCVTVILSLALSVFLWRYDNCNHRIRTMASVLLIVSAVTCAFDIARGAHLHRQGQRIIPGHASCIAVLMYMSGTSVLSLPINACSVAASLSSVACMAALIAAAL